jgi:hypothetical protein
MTSHSELGWVETSVTICDEGEGGFEHREVAEVLNLNLLASTTVGAHYNP